jgi:hypothetical protein
MLNLQFPLRPTPTNAQISTRPAAHHFSAAPKPAAGLGGATGSVGHTKTAGSGPLPKPAAGDYLSCDTVADTPPQEIIDLAAALNNDPNLIFHYVLDNIDLEPTAESSKGPLGTYLDQSGNSFDQSSLLVALLRAAAVSNSNIGTVQFVIGTATLTTAQMGLASLPTQLVSDAGGNSSGQAYAWVQVQINGQSVTMDPAGKTYVTLTGTNITNYGAYSSLNSTSAVSGWLSALATNIYTTAGQNTASLTAFIGGRRLSVQPTSTQYNPYNRSGGTAYSNLPFTYRSTFGITWPDGSSHELCTDQVYGHVLSAASSSGFTIDGLELYAFPTTNGVSTVYLDHQINLPGGGTTYPWSQTAAEGISPLQTTVFSLGFGRVAQFRAQHDNNLSSRAAASGSTTVSPYLLATISSSQLAQTSRANDLLDQLAGTYTVNHHTVQLVRSNQSVDTPMTAASTDSVNTSPSSGLSVKPASVTYALSALQSAQEASALLGASLTQSTSAASLFSTAQPRPT